MDFDEETGEVDQPQEEMASEREAREPSTLPGLKFSHKALVGGHEIRSLEIECAGYTMREATDTFRMLMAEAKKLDAGEQKKPS